MAIYHVFVRDYFWKAGQVMVQCPFQKLQSDSNVPIIRPLAGVNQGEPRFVESVDSLEDPENNNDNNNNNKPYTAEAHGVYVPADSPLDRVPVWVPFRQQQITHDHHSSTKLSKQTPISTDVETVSVADLRTSEPLTVPKDQICWVPKLEAPDGRICTIVARQLTVGRKKMSHVLVQSLGAPGSARFVLLSARELSQFSEVDEDRRKELFEIQLMMVLKQKKVLSVPLQNALRLVLSSQSRQAAKRVFWNILDDTTTTSQQSDSEVGGDTYLNDLDTDLESIRDSPRSSITATSVITCKCTYPLLCPTATDPYPQHRHILDHECRGGSQHKVHCVFADHSPSICVIPQEFHRHCSIQPQAKAIQIQLSSSSSDVNDYDHLGDISPAEEHSEYRLLVGSKELAWTPALYSDLSTHAAFGHGEAESWHDWADMATAGQTSMVETAPHPEDVYQAAGSSPFFQFHDETNASFYAEDPLGWVPPNANLEHADYNSRLIYCRYHTPGPPDLCF